MLGEIGIREAKTHFSRLVAEVKHGAEWIITERGTPVAKLGPIPEEERPLSHRLAVLEARGLLARPQPGRRNLPPPLPLPAGLAQQWLQEDRGR